MIGSFFNLITQKVEFTRFINCTFHDNVAAQGGGLALVDGSFIELTKAKVINSLFNDNRAIQLSRTPRAPVAGSGGAIIVYGENAPPSPANKAEIEITNCTVVNNWAQNSMGGFYLWNVNDTYKSIVQNSVFWHNNSGFGGPTTGAEIAQQGGDNTGTKTFLEVRYTDVEGGLSPSPDGALTTVEVTAVDPVFVDETNKDFRLEATSPVLDGGDPNSTVIPPLPALPIMPIDDFDLDDDGIIAEPTPDLDFMPRELDSQNNGGSIVNMGAYESFYTCCADVAAFDHNVNVTDLLALLAAWGACPTPCQATPTCVINTPDSCPEDIFRDCNVNVTDLLQILAGWGSAPSCFEICDACGTLPPIVNTIQEPSMLAFDGRYGPVSDIWIISGSNERRAADEFEPTINSMITQIQWWGFYEGPGELDCSGTYSTNPDSELFTISYFDSAEHQQTGQLVPSGNPTVFDNVSVLVKKPLGEYVGGSQLYFYTAEHDPVNVNAGTAYFVEIKNTGGDDNGSSGCHWRWAWSNQGTLLYSVEDLEDDCVYLTCFDPGNDMNLAYGLNIDFIQIDALPPPEGDEDPTPFKLR